VKPEDKANQQFIYDHMYEGRSSKFRPHFTLFFSMLFGLGLGAAGVLMYRDIADKELTGGTIRMPWALIELYKLGGKLAVAIPFVLFGLLMMYTGITTWLRYKRQA
jgi:hypothetical protein